MNDYNPLIQAFLSVARPLEIARYQYLKRLVSKRIVLNELQKFQNDDGGFAHGLEPDYYNPNSTPIQTWYATMIMKELELDPSELMILKTLTYLRQSFDRKHNVWPLKVMSSNQFPAAPWWLYNEEDLNNSSYNPTASLAGFMISYGNKEDQEIANLVIDHVFKSLEQEDMTFERHEISCLLSLFTDLSKINFRLDEQHVIKLKEIILNEVEKDEKKLFNDYVAKPSNFLNHPQGFMHQELTMLLKQEINYLDQAIDQHNLFKIPWSWGNEETFKSVKKAWQGIQALEYFILLNNFNLL
jgi:hypothetical protein